MGVAQRLREAIGARRPSQAARELGVSPETVRRYLLGRTGPNWRFLRTVCDTYEISATWLLFGTGAMRHADARREMIRAAPARAILLRLAELLADREEPAGSSDALPALPGVATAISDLESFYASNPFPRGGAVDPARSHDKREHTTASPVTIAAKG